MPKVADYCLTWLPDTSSYLLVDQRCQQPLDITPGERDWFAWLADVPSFAFHGRQGQVTLRKESRGGGEGYWYAYRRVDHKMAKKYVGRTLDLTLAHLEDTAGRFSIARPAPSSAATPPSPQALVLATKLHRPRIRGQLIARAALVERLHQGTSVALTLLSAPAGFGKTTLLGQWLAECRKPAAWLALEAEDNDQARFLIYLIAAFKTIDRHLTIDARNLLQTASAETVVVLLTNALMQSLSEDVALVLDDYHVITAQSIHSIVAYLLDHLPPRLHLVIATRSDPPLPLARLRARGNLVELRATALRFTTEDADAFLRGNVEVQLSTEDIQVLESRTEGWIAGLQLAALALRGHTDIAAFLTAFTGSHRFIIDYLSEEVLAQQPAEIQAFLLHTAVLEKLSGPLCDAVTEQSGSQAILERLDAANLFVVTLDDERQWYRYHHLFADVLRNHLQRHAPEQVAGLHRRASVWYERQGFAVEAVQHALSTGDVERAADLIEQVALAVALTGQVETVLNWLNGLPVALVRSRPLLGLFQADMLRLTNQMVAAKDRLLAVDQALHRGPPTEQTETMLGTVAALRAHMARAAGARLQSIAYAEQALSHLPEQELFWRASAVVNAAHVFLLHGDVTPAVEEMVTAAIAPARQSGDLALLVISITLLAELQIHQGRLLAAAATYASIEHELPQGATLSSLISGPAYFFGLGNVMRQWNHLDEAERLLMQGQELAQRTRPLDADEVLIGYASLAKIYQARGDHTRALATFDAFDQLAQTHHYSQDVQAANAARRAQTELRQGNLAAALRWVQMSKLSTSDTDLTFQYEPLYAILVQILTAHGRTDPTGAVLPGVLGLLERLLADATAKGRKGSAVVLLVLQALAYAAQGNEASAMSSLQEVLSLAEPEGYVRVFVDEGEPMHGLLRQAQRHGFAPLYVSTLLAAFGEPQAPTALPVQATRSPLIEPLTPREREILHLINTGASNGAIARKLVVSINTVKRHVYNICAKLGVQSRIQAIVRARALDLTEMAAHLAAIPRDTSDGLRDYTLLLVALHTGRRAAEIASLRCGHLHLTTRAITIHWPHLKGGKMLDDALPLRWDTERTRQSVAPLGPDLLRPGTVSPRSASVAQLQSQWQSGPGHLGAQYQQPLSEVAEDVAGPCLAPHLCQDHGGSWGQGQRHSSAAGTHFSRGHRAVSRPPAPQ